jgi:CopG family transcriptional regulator / antitoxin EndoAI
MKGGSSVMHRRINITLPEATIRLIDRVAAKGDRSRLIAEAVSHYVETTGRARMRKRLKEGAIRRAERDRQLVADWFALDDEAWQRRAK